MQTLYLLSVWLHILSVATWLGGMLFLVLVIVPVTRRPEYRGISGALLHWLGVRFRTVGWVCLGLLVLTGVVNLTYRGIGWATLVDARFWNGAWGQTLGIKLLLVSIILLASAYHDFYVGPEATVLWQRDPSGARTQRLRWQARWIGRVNLLLALIVVALGVMLVRGLPF